MSLSFSCTPARPGDCVATLARRSDAALYAAKGAGRNRVERGLKEAPPAPSNHVEAASLAS